MVCPVCRYATVCPSLRASLRRAGCDCALTRLAVWDGDPLLLSSRLLGFPSPSSAVQTPSPHGTKGEGIQLLTSCHSFCPWGAEPECKLWSSSEKSPWWAQPGLQGKGRAKLPSFPDIGVAFGGRDPSVYRLD